MGSPAFKADSYPFCAQLRAKAPASKQTTKNNLWFITRYRDVVGTLKDECFVKNVNNALPADQAAKTARLPGVFNLLDNHMLDRDVADHMRMRGLVHKAFTPGRVEQMRTRIQQLSDEPLD